MLFSVKCNDFRGLVFQSARSRRIDGETSKHSDLDEIEKRGNDMKKWIALAALLAPLSLAGCAPRPVVVYSAPPPPPALADAGRQGYNDGVAAAQRDLARGNPLVVENRPRFRHPPVPPPLVEDFRRGFRAGYEQVVHHGAPPPPPGY
jgi:hypothetical protein